jgi:hypothetical protein
MSARFVIINTCDAPIRDNVAEWLFDGMDPSRPTNIEDFGFQVSLVSGVRKKAKRKRA